MCGTLFGRSGAFTRTLKLNPANLRLNTSCLECMTNGTRDLMQMGVSRTDAKMLLREATKEEIIDTLKLYDSFGKRKEFLDVLRAETFAKLQEQRTLWGRELNLGKTN